MFSRLILTIAFIGLITTSCVSNYVVSTNSFSPNAQSNTKHFTANGIEIPKANSFFKNDLDIDVAAEQVKLESEHLNNLELPVVEEEYVPYRVISYKAYQVLDEAKTYLGTPYVYGGSSRRGIDCSAFTQKVFGAYDIFLPRVARSQAKTGEYVNRSELQEGDLLFFITRGSYISHVGIVESIGIDGEINFIHASSSQGVTISSLSAPYWSARFQYAKRVI